MIVERRVTEKYVKKYDVIVLTQPLAHDRYVKQTYHKRGDKWKLLYSSNSAYHICPYDGVFRDCKLCGALEEDFDPEYCIDKMIYISTAALVGRINDCLNANLMVNFYYIEDLME